MWLTVTMLRKCKENRNTKTKYTTLVLQGNDHSGRNSYSICAVLWDNIRAKMIVIFNIFFYVLYCVRDGVVWVVSVGFNGISVAWFNIMLQGGSRN